LFVQTTIETISGTSKGVHLKLGSCNLAGLWSIEYLTINALTYFSFYVYSIVTDDVTASVLCRHINNVLIVSSQV